MSPVTCHMLHVTCYELRVMCHISLEFFTIVPHHVLHVTCYMSSQENFATKVLQRNGLCDYHHVPFMNQF